MSTSRKFSGSFSIALRTRVPLSFWSATATYNPAWFLGKEKEMGTIEQARVAKVLGVTQDSVSRLEKRSDILLSTLRKTVKAMGGDVRTIAEFPDRAPVVLSELSEEEPPRKSRRHARNMRRLGPASRPRGRRAMKGTWKSQCTPFFHSMESAPSTLKE